MKRALTVAWLLWATAGGEPPPDSLPAGDPKATALRAAVEDLGRVFPGRYDAPGFLSRLDAWERSGRGADAFSALQRDALLANPLVRGQPILFVVRPQYLRDHHNTETMFQTGEINTGSYRPGGPLKLLDPILGSSRTLVDPGPEGLLRDPDVHFDGGRIVFAMRRGLRDDYHLYEVNADGSGLRPLTSAPGVFDIDPFYLPDDGIGFTSSREPKYCGCNVHIMGNLFRMDAGGANIRQIGRNNLFEGHGSLLPDGRILYDRWEYVDRNFGDAQGLWTANPDGTAHATWYGNNTPAPGGVIDARAIPGSALVIAVLGSCHDRPWGALAILDRARGVDGRGPVARTWPSSAAGLVREPGEKNNAWDDFMRVRPLYEDPFPLADPATGAGAGRYFLCARQTGEGERMGIYVIDVFGNEALLHVEGAGCYDPQPLAPRPRPPRIPDRVDYTRTDGLFYVRNVYAGTHMQGVTNGAVKWLRVVEAPEKRHWTHPAWNGQGVHRPGMNWSGFENKRILGTVPVEADGSACFAAPADRFLYFQLLDGDGLMIQSMRSGASLMPGETTGCVGCHEERRTSAVLSAGPTPRAMQKPPARMDGWRGPPRYFNFLAETQPVFDRHCARCHDYGKPAGEKLILARDRTAIFNAAYVDLYLKGKLKVVGGGPAEIQPAYSWGARASRLVQVLRAGHRDLTLSAEEFDRIATWVDLNAPYYPSYAAAHPGNLYGRCPLDPPQVKRLRELGIDLEDRPTVRDVSFDRPEASPALNRLGGTDRPEYQEALAILRAGQARLAQCPNPDAPGFVACATDLERERKYQRRLGIELCARDAVVRGRQFRDGDPLQPVALEPFKDSGW